MENFDCKAPMYFNFSDKDALLEVDGADKFFERLNTGPHRRSLSAPSHLTIPVAPKLLSHLRYRPVHYMTQEEREAKEAEEMKAFKLKANPLNPKILEAPERTVRVVKKAPTKIVPFNLTEVRKKKPESPEIYKFVARPIPKKILEKTQGVPPKKEIPLTDPVSPSCNKRMKVFATALDKPESPEIYKFVARPIPKKILEKTQGVPPKKEIPLTDPVSPSCNKQMKVFATALDLEEEAKQLQQMAQFKARPATVILKKPFEPKKLERPLTDITAVELNTEKRAKEREEFDMKVKLKQAEQDALRRQREEEQKRWEEEEVARLRKEAVHKAKPVPKFKPLEVLRSDKPLTDP